MKLHYTLLREFNRHHYRGFIGRQHLREEIAIKKEKFWLAEYNKQKFLLTDEMVQKLPIVVINYEPVMYRNKVYNYPSEWKTAKLPPEKFMSFRELVDWFKLDMSKTDVDGNEYSEEQYEKSLIHNLLYRIIILAAEIDRINFRISTNPGFGKNSIATILGALMNDVSEANPRSAAAVEYRLNNKLLVLDEMSNLESSQKQLIQNLLLQIGDFSPTYEKGTRATHDTYDIYDISHLSLLIFYNRYEDYVNAGQEDKFFDNVFTKAVTDRFPAVRFMGTLDQRQFIKEPNPNDWVLYEEEYKQVMRTIRWYRKHWREEAKDVSEVMDNYKLYGNRHYQSIYKVLQFIELYSETPDEFKYLANELFNAYYAYKKSTNGGIEPLTSFQTIDVSEVVKNL